MDKFRFYIVDTYNGTVMGTNEETHARSCADEDEDLYVIDAESNLFITADGDVHIEELDEDPDEDPDDDDDNGDDDDD